MKPDLLPLSWVGAALPALWRVSIVGVLYQYSVRFDLSLSGAGAAHSCPRVILSGSLQRYFGNAPAHEVVKWSGSSASSTRRSWRMASRTSWTGWQILRFGSTSASVSVAWAPYLFQIPARLRTVSRFLVGGWQPSARTSGIADGADVCPETHTGCALRQQWPGPCGAFLLKRGTHGGGYG